MDDEVNRVFWLADDKRFCKVFKKFVDFFGLEVLFDFALVVEFLLFVHWGNGGFFSKNNTLVLNE